MCGADDARLILRGICAIIEPDINGGAVAPLSTARRAEMSDPSIYRKGTSLPSRGGWEETGEVRQRAHLDGGVTRELHAVGASMD